MYIHRGRTVQRGYGLGGGFFRGLFKMLVPMTQAVIKHPVARSIARSAAKNALKGGVGLVTDVLWGKKVQPSVASRVRNAKKNLANKLDSAVGVKRKKKPVKRNHAKKPKYRLLEET